MLTRLSSVDRFRYVLHCDSRAFSVTSFTSSTDFIKYLSIKDSTSSVFTTSNTDVRIKSSTEWFASGVSCFLSWAHTKCWWNELPLSFWYSSRAIKQGQMSLPWSANHIVAIYTLGQSVFIVVPSRNPHWVCHIYLKSTVNLSRITFAICFIPRRSSKTYGSEDMSKWFGQILWS